MTSQSDQIIQLLEPTLPCWNIFISVQRIKETKHVLCLCLYPILCCPSTLLCRYNLAEFFVSFCPSTSIMWKVFSGRPFRWCLIQLNEQVNLLQKKDKNHFFYQISGLDLKTRTEILTQLGSTLFAEGNLSATRARLEKSKSWNKKIALRELRPYF